MSKSSSFVSWYDGHIFIAILANHSARFQIVSSFHSGQVTTPFIVTRSDAKYDIPFLVPLPFFLVFQSALLIEEFNFCGNIAILPNVFIIILLVSSSYPSLRGQLFSYFFGMICSKLYSEKDRIFVA